MADEIGARLPRSSSSATENAITGIVPGVRPWLANSRQNARLLSPLIVDNTATSPCFPNSLIFATIDCESVVDRLIALIAIPCERLLQNGPEADRQLLDGRYLQDHGRDRDIPQAKGTGLFEGLADFNPPPGAGGVGTLTYTCLLFGTLSH